MITLFMKNLQAEEIYCIFVMLDMVCGRMREMCLHKTQSRVFLIFERARNHAIAEYNKRMGID